MMEMLPVNIHIIINPVWMEDIIDQQEGYSKIIKYCGDARTSVFNVTHINISNILI